MVGFFDGAVAAAEKMRFARVCVRPLRFQGRSFSSSSSSSFSSVVPFSTHVFDSVLMQERLPAPVYKHWRECVDSAKPLSLETADVIATALKDWAVSKGATHYR